MNIKKITLRPCTGATTRKSYKRHRPRIYVWLDSETIIQNMQDRRDRPYTVYKKEVLPALFRLLGIAPVEVRWSQKAGCSCPCSPGFIVPNYDIPYDIHVTITDKHVNTIEIAGAILA